MSQVFWQRTFLRHVANFLRDHRPAHHSGSWVVALSGGMDSVVLLDVARTLASEFGLQSPRAIHIHHHTRVEQDHEAEFCQQLCKQWGIALTIVKLAPWESQHNFEARARKLRQEVLLGALKEDEVLWQGHHLNDSVEWALLRQARSSELNVGKGIPLWHGQMFRPLLCVSREQIAHYAVLRKLLWMEDPTNQSLHYERNYLRQKVLAPWLKRRPELIKNFVYRNLREQSLKHDYQVHVHPQGSFVLGNPLPLEPLLQEIQRYSGSERGQLVREGIKAVKAHAQGKSGPLNFTGGVRVYLLPQGALVVSRTHEWKVSAEWCRQQLLQNSVKWDLQDFWRWQEAPLWGRPWVAIKADKKALDARWKNWHDLPGNLPPWEESHLWRFRPLGQWLQRSPSLPLVAMWPCLRN